MAAKPKQLDYGCSVCGLSFFFAKQVLDYSALFGIGNAFEHCPVMVNVLTGDIAFHENLRRLPFPRQPLS
jgi:hypothetical protein